MEDKNLLVAVDPVNSKKVRFTDNSPKDGDYVPEDQVAKPLLLNAKGAPYSAVYEGDTDQVGDGERMPLTEEDLKALDELAERLKEEANDHSK